MNQRNDAKHSDHTRRRTLPANDKTRGATFASLFLLLLICAGVACSDSSRGLASGSTQAGAAGSYSGQWLVEYKTGDDRVHLSLRYERENHHSNTSREIMAAELAGLTREQAMSANGTQVKFQLQRDAGAFLCEGWFRNGKGSGHFVFAPNPSFISELTRRGYDAPSDEQQFSMALHEVSLAFVEELRAQGYERPTLAELVQTGEHGVHLEYVRGLKTLGYSLRSVPLLIKMRDHGVSLNYVRELAAHGYARVPAEELIRTRDHGVSADFVKTFAAEGYEKLTLDQLIQLRDHGVSATFVKELRELGYERLPVEQLRNMRDHGVNTGFIKELKQLGYERVPVEQLIRLRDHGVSASYIQKIKSANGALSLDQIIEMRDRGAGR
jgi:hypothetical protein